MNFYPIFLREMIIFKRQVLKFGYLFSSMVTPVLYLLAFGLGRGVIRGSLLILPVILILAFFLGVITIGRSYK